MARNLTVSILLKMVDAVSGPAGRVTKAVKDAAKEFDKFQKRSDAAFKKAANLNQSAEALGRFNKQLLALAAAPVDQASNFEAALARLRIEADVGAKEIGGLGANIMKMASGTEFSATQVTQAYLELDDAGFSVADTTAQMGKIMRFATGASIGLKDAAQLTGSVLKSFHRPASEAGKVTDVVSAAANTAGVNVADFGRGLAGIGDKARAVGVSVESAATVMTLFSKSGLSAGEAAGATQSMITRLGSPRNIKATEAVFRALGVKSTDKKGNLKDLPTLLEEIGKSIEPLGNVTRQRVFEKLFGRETAASANALFQAIKPEKFAELRKELSASEGTAERNAEIMEKTAQVNREKLNAALANLATTVGVHLLPHLTKFLALMTKGVERVSTFAAAHPGLSKALALVFSGLVAVTGALTGLVTVMAAARTAQAVFLLARGFLSLGGALSSAVTQAPATLSMLAGIKTAALAAAPAAGVVGAVAAAFAGLGLAIFELRKHWDELTASNIWNQLKGVGSLYAEGAKGGDIMGLGVIGQTLNPSALLEDLGLKENAAKSDYAKFLAQKQQAAGGGQRVGVDMHLTIDSQGRPAVAAASATGGLNLDTDTGMTMVSP